MTTNDTQLIELLMSKLNIKTRDDLIYWVENFGEGYECDHYYGMVYDDGGYRVETEEEKAEKRRKWREHNCEMRRRWNAGERTIGTLLWKTSQSYMQKLEDNIFNAKPLLFQLTEKNEEST